MCMSVRLHRSLPFLTSVSFHRSVSSHCQELPEDWNCPFCGADKSGFESRTKKVAGFVQNQGYGFGNSMTGDEKLKLIYGSLLFFFFLFICGYAFN